MALKDGEIGVSGKLVAQTADHIVAGAEQVSYGTTDVSTELTNIHNAIKWKRISSANEVADE